MRFPFAPEGFKIMAYTTVATIVSYLTGNIYIIGLMTILWLFVMSFFRDPLRLISREKNTVYSAADGLITTIDKHKVNGIMCHRIVTFLSVFNCHVNRIPYEGEVLKTTHTPGLYLAAYKGQIDKENERQETLFETDKGPMKVVQITGAIARRIFCHLEPKQQVKTGERFGLIRFGSRTDVYIPETAKLKVKKGQMIKGGLSILATWD